MRTGQLARIRIRKSWIVATASVFVIFTLIGCGSSGSNSPVSSFPIYVEPALVAQGQQVYLRNCFECHGDDQQRPLLPSAPAHNEVGHTWHHQDRLLVDWILDGVPFATTMPIFRDTLTETEVVAAIAYIKTFWSPEVRDRQTEGSLEYEKQLAEFNLEP